MRDASNPTSTPAWARTSSRRTTGLGKTVGGAAEASARCRPEHACRIDLHPRPHGRGDGDPLDIGALGAGGLRLLHRVGEGADVLDELALLERRLADAGMDDAGLLDPELDRAALRRADGDGDV